MRMNRIEGRPRLFVWKIFSFTPFPSLSTDPFLDNIVRQCVGFSSSGSEGNMKHGLSGYLAGLSVLVGALESPRVLSCLTRCQESLDTPAMELLQPSMELLTNNGTKPLLVVILELCEDGRVVM